MFPCPMTGPAESALRKSRVDNFRSRFCYEKYTRSFSVSKSNPLMGLHSQWCGCGHGRTLSAGVIRDCSMNETVRNEPLAYRVKTFCASVGLGRTKFYELVRDGKIKTI